MEQQYPLGFWDILLKTEVWIVFILEILPFYWVGQRAKALPRNTLCFVSPGLKAEAKFFLKNYSEPTLNLVSIKSRTAKAAIRWLVLNMHIQMCRMTIKMHIRVCNTKQLCIVKKNR